MSTLLDHALTAAGSSSRWFAVGSVRRCTGPTIAPAPGPVRLGMSVGNCAPPVTPR
jgi:hypothetical protein